MRLALSTYYTIEKTSDRSATSKALISLKLSIESELFRRLLISSTRSI